MRRETQRSGEAKDVQVSVERGTAGSKMLAMKNTFTAVIKQDAGWWIGWIEEVPGVNCQAKTRTGLLRSLRETLKEALEMNREEARTAAGEPMEEELIQV
jgi:predicted RNase H-like HicB family nuclease